MADEKLNTGPEAQKTEEAGKCTRSAALHLGIHCPASGQQQQNMPPPQQETSVPCFLFLPLCTGNSYRRA